MLAQRTLVASEGARLEADLAHVVAIYRPMAVEHALEAAEPALSAVYALHHTRSRFVAWRRAATAMADADTVAWYLHSTGTQN